MKIFISHSQKDKKLAKEFKELFENFKKKTDVFLSSNITSDQIKSKQWKENFEKNIKECSHVVVLVSPNSLNSKWVQYETGYASASGKDIIPIGIKGVSPEDFFLNAYSMQIINRIEDLIKLLCSIFEEDENLTELWCNAKEKKVKNLLDLCKERCVYFVGSRPTSDTKWKQSSVNYFLEGVTGELLKKGIKVSSFPSVDEVGKIVCKAAMAGNSELYEISGLYQFDQIPEYENGKTVNPVMWKKTTDGYRRLYLKNKSSMIIIGGGAHTREEYDVAAKEFKNIEIFPIPCMGGLGEELFCGYKKDEERCRKFNHPCLKCKDYNKPCERIKEFVERLSQYNYINEEDERES